MITMVIPRTFHVSRASLAHAHNHARDAVTPWLAIPLSSPCMAGAAGLEHVLHLDLYL